MSHPKDDMVLRPDPKGKGAQGEAERARERRKRRRIWAKRIEKVGKQTKRRALQTAARVAQAMKVSRGLSAAARAKSYARAPAAIVAAVGVAGFLAIMRNLSGRSFEAQGAILNDLAFGYSDDLARAGGRARADIAADPLGATFGTGGGNRLLFDRLKRIYALEEIGESVIRTDYEGGGRYDVNGTADVIAEGVWREAEHALRWWKEQIDSDPGALRPR